MYPSSHMAIRVTLPITMVGLVSSPHKGSGRVGYPPPHIYTHIQTDRDLSVAKQICGTQTHNYSKIRGFMQKFSQKVGNLQRLFSTFFFFLGGGGDLVSTHSIVHAYNFIKVPQGAGRCLCAIILSTLQSSLSYLELVSCPRSKKIIDPIFKVSCR